MYDDSDMVYDFQEITHLGNVGRIWVLSDYRLHITIGDPKIVKLQSVIISPEAIHISFKENDDLIPQIMRTGILISPLEIGEASFESFKNICLNKMNLPLLLKPYLSYQSPDHLESFSNVIAEYWVGISQEGLEKAIDQMSNYKEL